MQKLEDSLKFKQWKASLEKNDIDLRGWEELKTVRKGNGEVLFSMIRIDALSPEQEPLLPVTLLRGHFVAVLTALIDRENGEEFHLLVRQRRVANGALFYEHPAGMCDSYTDPFEVALHEVEEETGLSITRDQLVQLNTEPLYSSPGLLDEGGYFFCCRIEMDRAEIDELHEKAAGTEGEYIHTYVSTPKESRELIKAANGVLLYYMYLDWAAEQSL